MRIILLSLLLAIIPTHAAAEAAVPDYYPQWLAEAPYAPRFEVRDTVNKYGRYDLAAKTITLQDLIKFHGHFCGGLVESAGALRLLFDQLFPDGVIDRTDLKVASNNSACGGDVVSYLTGTRARFGSHLIDPSLKESVFVVQRVSSGKTLKVRVNQPLDQAYVRSGDNIARGGARRSLSARGHGFCVGGCSSTGCRSCLAGWRGSVAGNSAACGWGISLCRRDEMRSRMQATLTKGAENHA